MSTSVRYTIECDGAIWVDGKMNPCGAAVSAGSSREAQGVAMEENFEKVNSRHYCRPCAQSQRSKGSP